MCRGVSQTCKPLTWVVRCRFGTRATTGTEPMLKHLAYGPEGCYSVSELEAQPIFREWLKMSDFQPVKNLLPKEAPAAEPYANMQNKAFCALFDDQEIRYLARLGMEDIRQTDPATYERMLANVPLDCEESFLGSFFTGGTISITFTAAGGQQYTLLLQLSAGKKITESCLYGHDDGNDHDAQLGWGVNETVPNGSADVQDGRLRLCVAGGSGGDGKRRSEVCVLEIGSQSNLLAGFDGDESRWQQQLLAIEASRPDVAIEVVRGPDDPYAASSASQPETVLKAGATAPDGSRRRVQLRLEKHNGVEKGWFLVLENNARAPAKYKCARHFAPAPRGAGYARVALVLQQTGGVIESRLRRRHGAALIATDRLARAYLSDVLLSQQAIGEKLKQLAQMKRVGARAGGSGRSHSAPPRRRSMPPPPPQPPRRRKPATEAGDEGEEEEEDADEQVRELTCTFFE